MKDKNNQWTQQKKMKIKQILDYFSFDLIYEVR